MANPNIIDATHIYGNNALVALTTTGATQIINNPASSGKVFLVTMIQAANVDGGSACNVSLSVHNQDDIGGTAYRLANTISVPADASLILLDKGTAFILKEDQSISATAGVANDLEITASWYEIDAA